MTFDDWTLVVWLSKWAILGVWELLCLILKKRTISVIAKTRGGWRISSIVYLDGGLPVHWWVNRDGWASTVGTVVFWLVPVGLLAWDVAWRKRNVPDYPKWARYVRWPLVMLVLGGIFAYVFFPQHGPTPWNF